MLRWRSDQGGCRFGGIRLFLLALAFGAQPLLAAESGLEALAEAGAPSLALSLLEARQPDPQAEPEHWAAWQRKRIGMLAAQESWAAMAEALESVPENMAPDFRIWSAAERARALLQAGEPAKARLLLAKLIWNGGAAEAGRLAVWREWIIQSYLDEQRPEDALTAMLRFRQDYGDGGREQALLRARVLLRSGRPEDAITTVAALEDDLPARVLTLTARLRAGAHPRQVIKAAERLLGEKPDPAERQELLQVIAEAAEQAGDPARRAIALERLLRDRDLGGTGPAGKPESLWRAYRDYAQRIGNRFQLLIGDDDAWFALAADEPGKYPVRARSLLAFLAAEAAEPRTRERAHGELVANLLNLPGGEALVARLYLESDTFGPPENLPRPVRYPLIDRAIRRGDLTEAARLLTGLEEPPERSERIGWQLRRARVFVLAGEYAKAAAVLGAMTAELPTLEPVWRDRLIQVVFDLQTVGEHEVAYGLFEQLAGVAEPVLRRELLYWMAESRQKQGQHTEAARLYLESAIMPGPAAMDPWAQTARYQAAKVLAEAGLVGDARTLLTHLLKVTEDPKRRAVLRRELEQLGLHRQGVSAP